MSKTLTAEDDFANVLVPEGGDARTAASVEPAFQALTDRTEALRQRGGNAAYHVTAAALGAGGTCTLTAQIASEGYELASNEVTVPAPGRYLVLLNASVTDADTADPTIQSLGIVVGGDLIFFGSGARPSDQPAQTIPITVIGVLEISDPETETIKVTTGVNAGASIAADTSYLTIVRLSELV